MSENEARFRAFSGGHSTIEYCLHMAGAEHYWASRLGGVPRSERGDLLERCLFEGFLHDGSFPSELSTHTLDQAQTELAWTFELIAPIFESPTESQLLMELTSPIGDAVSGREGLLRLSQHAAYHAGQIMLLQQMLTDTGGRG